MAATKTKVKTKKTKKTVELEQEVRVIGDAIRNKVFNGKVKLISGGNSNRKRKNVLIDMIHQSGESYKDIAAGAYLAARTVRNLAEEVTQNPQSETEERLLAYFQTEMIYEGVVLKPNYRNKPKR